MRLLAAIFFAGVPAAANGGVDGLVEPGEYPPALAAQSTPTGFGNNLSELNACYGAFTPATGLLRLALTGNLEGNGNTFVVLFDARPGGCVVSSLAGGFGVVGSISGQFTDDWGVDIDGGPGVFPTPGGGSALPPGFDPDFAIAVSVVSDTFYADYVDLTAVNDPTVNPDFGRFLGQGVVIEFGGGAVTLTDPVSGGTIDVAFAPYLNAAGVNGEGEPGGDPLTAVTGLEIEVSSALVGPIGQPTLKFIAFLTNGGGDYISNQILPPLGPDAVNPGLAGELGPEDPLFDARLFPSFAPIELPAQTPCPRDLTGDRIINGADLAFILGSWGPSGGPGDVTGDGIVNAADLSALLGSWGPCPP